MAAQGFLLIATFLLTFLFPVQRALSAYFFAHLASLTVR